MEIPFVGGSYQGFSLNIDSQVCQNLFVEVDKEGGKPFSLYGLPGTKCYCDFGLPRANKRWYQKTVGGYLHSSGRKL